MHQQVGATGSGSQVVRCEGEGRLGQGCILCEQIDDEGDGALRTRLISGYAYDLGCL